MYSRLNISSRREGNTVTNAPSLISISKKLDPFVVLPFEIIAAHISPLLSQDERVICLQVSQLWRQIILDSANAWCSLSLENDQKDAPLAHVASSLAHHVKYLTIGATANTVRSEYMKELKEGHFKNIQFLRTTVIGVPNGTEFLKQTSAALCQIGNTLTRLNIDIGDTQTSMPFILILSTCRCLTDLIYSTETSLSVQMKNFGTLIKDDHLSLVNLELSSPLIVGNDVALILQGCQKLRRLVLDDCDHSVLHVLALQPTPNLELLSFNDKIDGPPLPMLQDEKDPEDQNNEEGINKQRGLKTLYTSYGESTAPSELFIPLMYKHRKTLENVRACLSTLSEAQVQMIYEKYPGYKLENLKHVATWLGPGIQEFMLRIICEAKELSSITAVGDYNLDLLFTTLMDKSPLAGLNLSHMYETGEDVKRLLIQLFLKYTHASSLPFTNDSTKTLVTAKSLSWIKLRYCNPMVTDGVLMSLTGIKTLRDIHLGGLTHISTWGMIQMFQKLDRQITHVFLHDMFLVTDIILVALGNLDNLSLVKLELLDQVTDLGVRALVDKKLYSPQKLITLEVTECKLITQDCIEYAQEKVKTVRYDSPYSEYYVTKAKNEYYVSRSAYVL